MSCAYEIQKTKAQHNMREWLSGGVSPCQGEGRGFESRLALKIKQVHPTGWTCFIFMFWTRFVLSQSEPWKNKNGGPHADFLVLPVALWSVL